MGAGVGPFNDEVDHLRKLLRFETEVLHYLLGNFHNRAAILEVVVLELIEQPWRVYNGAIDFVV